MDEYGAAAPGNARPRVVVELDNQIIEPVVAAQPIAWFIGRPAKGPVITAIRRVFAPSVGGPDSPNRQRCPRLRQAVGPPPQAHRMKPAGRGAAVAFALVGQDAAAAERNRQSGNSRTGDQPALGSLVRPSDDADQAQPMPSHNMIVPIPKARAVLYR
jgi:hypothetical protein